MDNSLRTRSSRLLRLQTEQDEIESITHLKVRVDLDDDRLWHYVIFDLNGPYHGGFYWGQVKFPEQYPIDPPSISLITPSGVFPIDIDLVHLVSKEDWQPSCTVGKMLAGIIALMSDTSNVNIPQKKMDADASLAFNCFHRRFRLLFPEFLSTFRRNPTDSLAISDEENDAHHFIPRDLVIFVTVWMLLILTIAYLKPQ